MTPYKFDVIGEVVHYRYHFSQLKQWLQWHREGGNCGPLLVKRKGNMLGYYGSGTLEHPMEPSKPFTGMRMMWMMHNYIFDGPLGTDEQICTPPKESFLDYIAKNSKFVMLDFSNKDSIDDKD